MGKRQKSSFATAVLVSASLLISACGKEDQGSSAYNSTSSGTGSLGNYGGTNPIYLPSGSPSSSASTPSLTATQKQDLNSLLGPNNGVLAALAALSSDSYDPQYLSKDLGLVLQQLYLLAEKQGRNQIAVQLYNDISKILAQLKQNSPRATIRSILKQVVSLVVKALSALLAKL